MSYDDVLELPLKVFTLYNGNINRLRAEEEIRTIRILLASQSTGDGVAETFQSLKDEMGDPIQTTGIETVKPDQDAFEKLQGLANVR